MTGLLHLVGRLVIDNIWVKQPEVKKLSLWDFERE
jgi:hypothetical protein